MNKEFRNLFADIEFQNYTKFDIILDTNNNSKDNYIYYFKFK